MPIKNGNIGYMDVSKTFFDDIGHDESEVFNAFLDRGELLHVEALDRVYRYTLAHSDFDVADDEYTLVFTVYEHPTTQDRRVYISALQAYRPSGVVTVKEYPRPEDNSDNSITASLDRCPHAHFTKE